MYTRPEDQFFHKLCKWSFQWKAKDSEGESIKRSCLVFTRTKKILASLRGSRVLLALNHYAFAETNDIDALKPLRLCMLFDASTVPAVRSELKSLFEPGKIHMTV